MPPARLHPEASSSDDVRSAEAALARRRQAYGVLLLAGLILLAVLLRAPAHVLFPAGWWRF